MTVSEKFDDFYADEIVPSIDSYLESGVDQVETLDTDLEDFKSL